MIIKENVPLPHDNYIVKRDGNYFTATPVYGIHDPLWVVKTMNGEAPPVPMNDDDEWKPVIPCFFALVNDEKEFGEPALLIVTQEFWNKYHHLNDSYLESQIHLPPCLVETQESVFTLNPKTEATVELVKKRLLAMGHVENNELLS